MHVIHSIQFKFFSILYSLELSLFSSFYQFQSLLSTICYPSLRVLPLPLQADVEVFCPSQGPRFHLESGLEESLDGRKLRVQSTSDIFPMFVFCNYWAPRVPITFSFISLSSPTYGEGMINLHCPYRKCFPVNLPLESSSPP